MRWRISTRASGLKLLSPALVAMTSGCSVNAAGERSFARRPAMPTLRPCRAIPGSFLPLDNYDFSPTRAQGGSHPTPTSFWKRKRRGPWV